MSRLEIKGLEISFPTRRGTIHAVRDLSLAIEPGQIFGVVGESGAGKSTIGNAVMGLLQAPGRISRGEILFDGVDLRGLDKEQMRKVRGAKIGIIFQDPQTSLNPLLTIGQQLRESVANARGMRTAEAGAEALRLLEVVGVPHAEVRMRAYPHQLSGGLRQRVVIALAMSGDPDLIIADEPTTALDVSIQSQILELIARLCRDRDLSVLLITHDIGVIGQIADHVAVMHQGRIVETGRTAQILGAPTHAYTQALISAVPRLDVRMDRFTTVDYAKPVLARSVSWLKSGAGVTREDQVALKVDHLSRRFVLKRAFLKRNRHIVRAVDDISFAINAGETFGLVGESGSGKSTVARLIAGLYEADRGDIHLFGKKMTDRREASQAAVDRSLQMIFQDPYSSLNGRMRVGDIIAEPIRFYRLTEHKQETAAVVGELLEYVGLDQGSSARYPHEFSGGQRQRVSIARALAARPRILVCDEPTSALDVSIQAQVLNLLRDLQERFALTILFISHDLPVIRQMCDRVGVMREGRLVELADADQIFDAPSHAYTKELISNIPDQPWYSII